MNVAWYVARAGGMLGLVLLTASVLVGLTLSGRARLPGWPRFAVEDVHRFAGLLAGTFVSLHVLALVADDYLDLGLADLLLPGAAPYRPLATAAGVLASELLLALALTNRYRKRLSHALWKRIHLLNFAVWLLAVAHGITAGSDRDTAWGLALYIACAGSVAGATAWRVARGVEAEGWAVALTTVTAALVSVELVVALALGPL